MNIGRHRVVRLQGLPLTVAVMLIAWTYQYCLDISTSLKPTAEEASHKAIGREDDLPTKDSGKKLGLTASSILGYLPVRASISRSIYPWKRCICMPALTPPPCHHHCQSQQPLHQGGPQGPQNGTTPTSMGGWVREELGFHVTGKPAGGWVFPLTS